VLAKIASDSGKRSRLHRGFSKGQVAFPPKPSPWVTRVGSLPPATRPSNRLASARAVSGVQGESRTCAAFAADLAADIDGRHAASDSGKARPCVQIFGAVMCEPIRAGAWASPARRPVSGNVGTGLVPADRLRVWAAGYRALWGVGLRQPSDVDYPLASPGQARRVLTERSGPPGIGAGRRSHK
jgi:hypothetical protein